MAETWILYQTTNVCNGKIYVGVHKLADTPRSRQYLGSGQAIKAAIKKYGRGNFIRVTLEEFSCAEDAYKAEAEMITEEFLKRSDTYNMGLGGKGGNIHTPETLVKISAAHKGKVISQEHKAKLITSLKGNTNMLGKFHTVEAKQKMSAARKSKKPNLGKVLSEEHKLKISLACTKAEHMVINSKYYISIKQVTKIECISYPSVLYRLKSPKPQWAGWRYATQKEKSAYALSELQ